MVKDHAGLPIKVAMYGVIIILVNLVSVNLFVRLDLTEGRMFTLSSASEKLIQNLSEPLTVKVFFSKNLPAPYNNVERYLGDLLREYAASGGRLFNFQFYNVSTGDEEVIRKNQELARSYGVTPVQIQNIEQDEVKFQNAYMGIALIHGELVENLPAITSTDGLEYKITTTIGRMSRKMSALLRMEEKIEVRLYLSPSLMSVGPYINIPEIAEVQDKIEDLVAELNTSHYGRFSFQHVDPDLDKKLEQEAMEHSILALNWESFRDRTGGRVNAGKGYIGIVVRRGEDSEMIPLLNVIRLPIFGTQYRLQDEEWVKKAIEEAVENLINVNEEIGYLVDHGTNSLGFGGSIMGLADNSEMTNFNQLLSEQYSVKRVSLEQDGIPEGLPSLIIAGAKEPFSEYSLYHIDQYLMKGRGLALFLDSFEEVVPPQQNQMQRMFQRQQPFYRPLNTGIEKLLDHYGVTIPKSIVLDDHSFKQRLPLSMGGGEQQVFFAPIIQKENINHDLDFLRNIKGLVMIKASPVTIDVEKLKQNAVTAYKLFSSSDASWKMEGRIHFNPMLIRKPVDDSDLKPIPLAYLLEGEFTSYFADKPIPEKPETESSEGETTSANGEGIDTSKVESEGSTLKHGKPARILIVGSSEILKDNILSGSGDSPNSQLVFNVLDYLNGREEFAVMRSKTQSFNPLDEVAPNVKTMIKTFNIAGLPLLMSLIGMGVWLRRAVRKRILKQIFLN